MGQNLCGLKMYVDLKNQGIISCWLKGFFKMGIWFCVLSVKLLHVYYTRIEKRKKKKNVRND